MAVDRATATAMTTNGLHGSSAPNGSNQTTYWTENTLFTSRSATTVSVASRTIVTAVRLPGDLHSSNRRRAMRAATPANAAMVSHGSRSSQARATGPSTFIDEKPE